MGFLDPLFFSTLAGFMGLLGASTLGVTPGWLYGESLYIAGCIYLLIRDWNAFLIIRTPSKLDFKPKFCSSANKSFVLYRYWVAITAVLGITAMGLGLMGDERLSSSAPRKILDTITSIIFVGKTFQYEAVNVNIGRSEKMYLTAGLLTPFAVGASKSAGLTSLFWACQRWLNPSSNFCGFKHILKSKVRLLPIILIVSAGFLSLFVALRASGASLDNLVGILAIRFSRDLDIYIFLDSLSEGTAAEIFSDSGGWMGGLFGGLSGSLYNIGSLAKAYANNITPDATGANPRLHALILAMNGLGNESTLISISVAFLEILSLSLLRKFQLGQRQDRARATFNFVAWTTIASSFHTDVSSLKYGLVVLISGHLLLKIRTRPATQNE